AIKRASKSIRNVSGAKIISQSVKVENGKIIKYKVNVDVVFGVED
ncbi:dodecin domain-containing protein, partial [Candidatus Woesearchaeota archaeon]|nr:dodecin domain-containing protein [Candidatus Woesearchaeota archaeon]